MRSVSIFSARKCYLLLAFGLLFSISSGPLRAETTDLGATFEISGKVANVQQVTNSSGYSFNVTFSGITYKGNVQRTLLERTDDRHVTIWLALRDTVLTIQSTDIAGGRRGASCGPLELVMGSQRELWLAFDLEQKDEGQSELVSTRFGLPSDNWAVGTPSWVQTWGLGMSEGRVVSGLRSGLMENPRGIEQQLIATAPEIFTQVEAALTPNLLPVKLTLK
jgi:hypothetical protein